MKLRRLRTTTGLELQALDRDGVWQSHSGLSAVGGQVFDAQWELDRAYSHLHRSTALLPFQPVSFRDCMLYERHSIDAARGLIRRFHPGQHLFVRTVESITRRTFPLLKPAELFYREPIYYMSNALTFVPTGTPIATPSYSRALDYELEIGFVLAAELFNASPEEATAAIGAFVLVNDFSARDVQRAEMSSGLGPQKCKHFISSMSDIAVTADEILPQINELGGSVAVDGRTVATISSAGMHHSLGEVLARASRDERLYPGELFGTGTLPGGSGMETNSWLRTGDHLTLSIDGIGTIEHDII